MYKNNIIINIQSIPLEILEKTMISYRYNYHNLQDNQLNNLNNQLTNQKKSLSMSSTKIQAVIKRYTMRYKIFTWKTPRNCGNKKS